MRKTLLHYTQQFFTNLVESVTLCPVLFFLDDLIKDSLCFVSNRYIRNVGHVIQKVKLRLKILFEKKKKAVHA